MSGNISLYTKSLLLLVLLNACCCFVMCVDINWSTLTAAELNNLNPTIFQTISSEELSQIPVSTCSGFRQEQIGNLNASACSGFSSAQVSNLDSSYPRYTCSGFAGTCISYMKAETFSGFNTQLTISATSSITKDQLSFISQSGMGGFTSDNIVGLKDSCAGLSANQISDFETTYPINACQGIQRECISSIPSNSFSGFKSTCVSQIATKSISVITSDQLSKLTNEGISGLNSFQLQTFSSRKCTGFTAGQIKSLNSAYPNYACQGFQSDCLSGLNMRVIPSFTESCFKQIPALSVKGFSSNAIPLFTSQTLKGLTSEQLKEFYKFFGLNQFVNVLTQKQIEYVSTNTILGFKYMLENKLFNRSRVIDQDELSTLSWLQLSVSTDGSVKNGITVSSIPSIVPQSIRGLLSYSQLFTDDFYTSFTIDQFDNLLSDTISSITMNQIENIPYSVFESPHSFFENFKYINLDAIKGVTKSQFTNLTGASYSLDSVMTCDQFRSLTQEQNNFLSTFDSYKNINVSCYRPIPQPSNPNPQPSISRPAPQPSSNPEHSIPRPSPQPSPQTSLNPLHSTPRPAPPNPSNGSSSIIAVPMISILFLLIINVL